MDLPTILQAVSHRRIQQEAHNAREKGFAAAEKFYQQLEHLVGKIAGTNSAVLQMGWGSGWSGMTVHLLSKPVQNEICRNFQLGRPPGQHGSWEPDLSKSFPKSRRLRAVNDLSGVPLGWVIMMLERLGKPSKMWQSLVIQSRAEPIPAPTSSTQKPQVVISPAATSVPTESIVQQPPTSEIHSAGIT